MSNDIFKQSKSMNFKGVFMNKYVVGTLFFTYVFLVENVSAEVLQSDTIINDPQTSRHAAFEHTQSTHSDKTFGWDSRIFIESDYITEGRNNLSGSGLYSVSTEFNYGDFYITPWLAKGISADYSEVNLNVNYGIYAVDKLEVFVGYGYLKSYEGDIDATDHEVNIDFSYDYRNDIQILASIYHSFDADGLFSEIAFIKSYKFKGVLLVDVSSSLGFNSGYIGDGHNGLNFGQLRVHASYVLKNKIELHAYTSYSVAVNEDSQRFAGDESLSNMLSGGAGLSYRF